MRRATDALLILSFIALAYAAVSTLAYGLAHPHKTQTEVFLSIPDAVTWTWDEER